MSDEHVTKRFKIDAENKPRIPKLMLESESMDMDDTNEAHAAVMLVKWAIPHIDDSNTEWSEKPPMDRFIGILDQIDTRVEELRKEAFKLQEKRDFLLLSMDLLKNNDILSNLNENEQEEIDMYVKRVGGRLQTVELNVKTVRDSAQEDSMHQVNIFIDRLISEKDAMCSRQKCHQYLYSCGTKDITKIREEGASSTDLPKFVAVDEKFENALLGCALDDQKIVRKRLQYLLAYLVKQSISD